MKPHYHKKLVNEDAVEVNINRAVYHRKHLMARGVYAYDNIPLKPDLPDYYVRRELEAAVREYNEKHPDYPVETREKTGTPMRVASGLQLEGTLTENGVDYVKLKVVEAVFRVPNPQMPEQFFEYQRGTISDWMPLHSVAPDMWIEDGATVRGSTIRSSVIQTGCRIKDSLVEGSVLVQTMLEDSLVRNSRIGHSELRGSDILGSDVRGRTAATEAYVRNSRVHNCRLGVATVRNGHLYNCNLIYSMVVKSTVKDSDLTDAQVYDVDMDCNNISSSFVSHLKTKNLTIVASTLKADFQPQVEELTVVINSRRRT